jgi:hypothetical protein
LHGLQVGQNHIGKQLGKGSKGIAHEQILSRNPALRTVTDGWPLVMNLPCNQAGPTGVIKD